MKFPKNHTLRNPEYVDRLRMTISTWGELKLTRDGFSGAEYYTVEDGLRRVAEFCEFGRGVIVSVRFCAKDSEDGYYLPDDDEISRVTAKISEISVERILIEEIPNLEIDGGTSHVPRFYYHRDENEVGLIPAAAWDKEYLVAEEIKYGFDSSKNSSLYK